MSRPAVLITGGAKRIGAQLTRAFAAAGWHVVIHVGHSPEAAAELAASLPSAETVLCDLLDGDAALAMIDGLAERLPDWRMLINCAAVFQHDTAQAIDPAVFAEAITKAKSTDPKAIIEQLETGSFTGWSSVPVTFPKADGVLWHNWAPPMMVLTYTAKDQAVGDAEVSYTLGK